MGKKTFLIGAVCILLAAVFIRVWVIHRNPIPAGDGIASHILLADNLKRGLGFRTFVKWTLYDQSEEFLRPEANRQPAMAFTMVPVFYLFGTGMLQAQTVALLQGLLAMFFGAFWAKRLFGREVALVVLAYMAVDPPFVWFGTQPDSLMLYASLFYLILIVADKQEISWKYSLLLGAMSGFLYLTRTQGMLMVPSMVLWALLRGGNRKWLKAVLVAAAALTVVSPWLFRNINEFGSPLYSQNGQFLLNENHWSAWSVRETAPSPMDMWNNQGPVAVARYLAAGVL
jgi:4-amino-4-deoxy-L-arabinose transferase-like glycosyltransferase